MTDNLRDNLYTKKKLRFNNDGNFKILMMSDIQETTDFNPITMNAIEKCLDFEKPDLVILGGDNCSANCNGYVVDSVDTMSRYLDIMTAPLEKRSIPWAHVWGNHDHDVRIDEDIQQSLYMRYEHCLSKNAKGVSGQSNFVLPVFSSVGDSIKFNVWGLDSGNDIYMFADDFYGKGSSLPSDALLPNKVCSFKSMWGFVSFDRIMWYYNSSIELEEYNGEKINSLMVTHIPVWEIYNIVHNHNECGTLGEHPENYALGTFNSGLFAAILQRKDVKAMCGGHSHLNDAAGTYCNVILSTDGSIGYSAYGDNERRGVRIFEVNENNTADVKTRMLYCKDLI